MRDSHRTRGDERAKGPPGPFGAQEQEQWWHLLSGNHEDCCEMSYLLCESPTHPEALLAEISQGLAASVCPLCKRLVLLVYVRSWNREPTDDEKQAALEP